MSGWPDRRVLDLFGIELPIVQAPMAGAGGAALASAVAQAGGLGSLPCALLGGEQLRAEVATFRAQSSGPINLNFFCHAAPVDAEARVASWRTRLRGYYVELGLAPDAEIPAPVRAETNRMGIRCPSRSAFSNGACSSSGAGSAPSSR